MCLFFWHKWEDKLVARKVVMGPMELGYNVYSVRRCAKCGKEKERRKIRFIKSHKELGGDIA